MPAYAEFDVTVILKVRMAGTADDPVAAANKVVKLVVNPETGIRETNITDITIKKV